MEQIRGCPTPSFFRLDMIKALRRKIPKEDITTTRGFTTDFFGNVPNRKINGVSGLAAKQCELRLVGRDDDWDDGGSRLLLLQSLLMKVSVLRFMIESVKLWLSLLAPATTNSLYKIHETSWSFPLQSFAHQSFPQRHIASSEHTP